MSRRPGLSDQEYRDLVGRMATKRKPVAAPLAERRAEPAPPAGDFSDLPGYRELQQQRAFADLVGLENPFFRQHEALATVETSIGGRRFLNFSSYDYLGLNGHPEVIDAAKRALDRYGVSASASRVVAGERPVHSDLEQALAKIYDADDCVVMVSGYSTNVTTIGSLMGPKDLVIHDALAHNSILMGAKLAGAERRSFAHNDMAALDALLASQRRSFERVLIVVEGLYSMDGDYPDLARLVEIKKRHGAWLMVDDAHGLGVLGRTGRGLAEEAGIEPTEVDLWMGTLSKTLAGCGGYIAGPRTLVDYLKCMAGGFVYSVGIPPVVATAVLSALTIFRREPERVARLAANSELFVACARDAGLDVGTAVGRGIVPVITGDSLRASLLAQRLYESGINVLPIIYPAVPERLARLRFFLTSEHTEAQIRQAVEATARHLADLPQSAAVLEQAMAARR